MKAKIKDITTPVVVVNCKLGALGIMRTLGGMGISLYGVDADRWSPGMTSQYCRERFLVDFEKEGHEQFLARLLEIGKKIGRPSVLIPTSDETSLFVAQFGAELSRYFLFPKIDPALVSGLISKEGMYELSMKHGVPTPHTLFPKKFEDILSYAEEVTFPVMVKGIYGNRLQARTGRKMALVHSRQELIETYKLLEDPDVPNLMVQEYIPGGDDQIFIFNGYFDAKSDCLAAFTGYKVRQFPVHVGCASLGECRWNEEVARTTVRFMKEIGYRGVLDIGYRLDPRDGLYKVLDINPRVGQAFRLFVAHNDMDVVKSLYLDLTGQNTYPIIPREGRRWVIEDFDIVSSFHYYQEGALRPVEWLRSFRRLEEGAWFNWKDPLPFLMMTSRLVKRAFGWLFKRVGIIKDHEQWAR